MDTMWMIAVLGIGGMVLAVCSTRFLKPRLADLGTMNDRWLAEQRLGQAPDPNR